MTLQRKPWRVPARYEINGEQLVPFMAGEDIAWTLQT